MTPRNQKQMLWAVNAALLVMAFGAILLLFWPIDQGAASTPRQQQAPTAEAAAVDAVGLVGAYEATGDAVLRRPLKDPPPAVQAAPRVVTPNVQLLGTAVESGVSYGMFRAANGDITIAKAGEMVDATEVLVVEEGLARVRFSGKEFVLPVVSGANP